MAERLNHSVVLDDMQLELDLLLRVSPSPEFVTRVRTQVAADPAVGERWVWSGEMFRVQWATAFGVIIVAAAAYWGWSMPGPKALAPIAVAPNGDVQLHSTPARANVLNAEATPVAVDRSHRVGHERPRAARVLVSANEAEALRQFVSAVHEGLIDAGDLPVPTPVGELAALDPIVWQPLVPAPGLEEEQQ